jgi:ribosomal protein S3
MARSENHTRREKIPLHKTLRPDFDYALAEAHTTVGTTGIKVWILQRRDLTARETFFHPNYWSQSPRKGFKKKKKVNQLPTE